MPKRTMIVEPQGALANRTRVLASAIALCEESGRQLQLVWKLTGKFKCPLGRLFKNGFQETRTVPKDALCYAHGTYEHPLRAIDVHGAHRAIFVRTCFPMMAARPKHRSYDRGGPLERGVLKATRKVRTGLTQLVPSDIVQERIQMYDVQGRIGIHIRHGPGNPWARSHSPLNLFWAYMDRWSEQGFFLATDSPQVQSRICENYPKIMVQQYRPAGHRRGPVAIEDALVDLLLLSKTIRIGGSCHSSFSQVAAAWGQIPLDIIHNYE